MPEKVSVPFEAVKGFFDPSVQFGLQFETIDPAAQAQKTDGAARRRSATRRPRRPRRSGLPLPANPDTGSEPADGEKQGAEVVRLDRFRKK